ncbi:MAG TPA: GNAT family N-acetyltransferase [Frankiaceae bacterium]|nr:GNAT family N-acetyltransferase [Frankiaceae bacterium]
MTTSIEAPDLRELSPDQVDALAHFLAELPEGDRTFVKEAVDDRAVVAGWASAGPSGSGQAASRWVASAGTEVVGYVAVLPLPGWSSHVGELRLVVAPSARGRGLGRLLAEHALKIAVGLGLTKLVVEVVAVQEGTIAMFNSLGFRGEALLTDHIRDGRGDLQDLVVLAHDVTAAASALETVGVED